MMHKYFANQFQMWLANVISKWAELQSFSLRYTEQKRPCWTDITKMYDAPEYHDELTDLDAFVRVHVRCRAPAMATTAEGVGSAN